MIGFVWIGATGEVTDEKHVWKKKKEKGTISKARQGKASGFLLIDVKGLPWVRQIGVLGGSRGCADVLANVSRKSTLHTCPPAPSPT